MADPPWRSDKRSEDASKWEDVPYATPSVEEIKALGVANLACPDAVPWPWATNAHLPDAFAVVRAWGFTYKLVVVWFRDGRATRGGFRYLTELSFFQQVLDRIRCLLP